MDRKRDIASRFWMTLKPGLLVVKLAVVCVAALFASGAGAALNPTAASVASAPRAQVDEHEDGDEDGDGVADRRTATTTTTASPTRRIATRTAT